VLFDVQAEIGEPGEQLLQGVDIRVAAAHDSASRPVADDVVCDDRGDVLEIGRLPELGEQLRRPAGGKQLPQPSFASTVAISFHLRVSYSESTSLALPGSRPLHLRLRGTEPYLARGSWCAFEAAR
jgi:hypothetical protein